MPFERHHINLLRNRLNETPKHLIAVTGPRQISKSTLVQQAITGHSVTFITADQPIDSFVSDNVAPTINNLPGFMVR